LTCHRNSIELLYPFINIETTSLSATRLGCGHHATFGHNLSNNITIYHDGAINKIRIECTLCGY